jgi:hypothetical protein
MIIPNIDKKKLSISSKLDYSKASFGYFHVAFLDNHDDAYLPLEDKESIKEALYFYDEKIKKRENYPIYVDGKFVMVEPTRREVLYQVLGLPVEIFQKLDTEKDILPQLKFSDGLFDLKKECYSMLSGKRNQKWYSDDFKLYCLKNGFFFLYDETKPFMNQEDIIFPVYIDEHSLNEKYLYLYRTATYERFAIDFLSKEDTTDFNKKMKAMDSFSFEERLCYFVNHEEDRHFENLDDNFKRKYTFLLKEYLSSIINTLYDDYCLNVLNRLTEKSSYLTISKIKSTREIYSISSYYADMYSLDGKKYGFALADKKKIAKQIQKRTQVADYDDLVCLYANLGLPFEGYDYIRDAKKTDSESLLAMLPFIEISHGEIYLSNKRYDAFYSYVSGEDKHRYAFSKRLLVDQGIFYDNLSFPDSSRNQPISIIIDNDDRCEALKRLTDFNNSCTFEEILDSYLYKYSKILDEKLYDAIKELDEKSNGGALYFLYHMFDGISFNTGILAFLQRYDMQNYISDSFLDFLWYCLFYPFEVAEHEYRIKAMEKKDTLSLIVLDGLPRKNETYEPNLPYPYVTFGKMAYSFRKEFFSKPYICSCQKPALEKRFQYYLHMAKDVLKFTTVYERNEYILRNLLLPGNIESMIDLDKEDIFSQIPFEDHICHLCNHTQPSFHESIDCNEEEKYNIFFTYIRAKASLKGVFIDDPLTQDYDFSKFCESVEKETYHSILSFDRKIIDPILLPYINISAKTITSLLCAFFPNEITYDDFYQDMLSFSSLGDDRIRSILFDCKKEDYLFLYGHMGIFSRLCYLYKMIEISYALYVSNDIVKENENEFSMNMDYNPKLRHPYVLLGYLVNAYSDDSNANHYYICDCEKDSLLRFAKKYSALYEERKLNPEIKTPVILGLLGLPYLVILKYQDYDLKNNSVESLIESMSFGSSICRRCLNIPHAAYDDPFRKAFPFKEDLEAEYSFSSNAMMHEGFKIISDLSPSEIHYDPSYRFDLNSYIDNLLPYFDIADENMPEILFTHFVMGKEKLSDLLNEFSLLNKDNLEANAYASGVILDSYFKDENCLFKFLFDANDPLTLQQRLVKSFSELGRVRKEFLPEVSQQILGFLCFLVESLLKRYARKESHVGR